MAGGVEQKTRAVSYVGMARPAVAAGCSFSAV